MSATGHATAQSIGRCACGCGSITRRLAKAEPRNGLVKGDYARFVKGHNARKPGAEYRTLMVGGKQIPIHRLRAEAALGKPLPICAVVHHADGSRREDAPLVICPDRFYHQLLHIRMRVKAAGGNPNTDAICATCEKAKPFSAFAKSKGRRYGLDTRCRECMREASESRRQANAAA